MWCLLALVVLASLSTGLCLSVGNKYSLDDGKIVAWDSGAETRGGIGVVTVAVIEERISIMNTEFRTKPGWREVALLGFVGKLVYSLGNGYGFYAYRRNDAKSLEPHWSKITALRAVLSLPHIKYAMFVDADAQFNRPDINIETLVARMEDKSVMLPSHRDLGTESHCRGAKWQEFGTWDCKDGFCPCEVSTGIMLFRKTDAAFKILDAWQAAYDEAEPKTRSFKVNHQNATRYDQFGFNRYVMAEFEPHVKVVDRTHLNGVKPHSLFFHPAGRDPDTKLDLLLSHFWSFSTRLLQGN